MLWKFTEPGILVRIQGEWRTRFDAQGVVLSLWLDGEALPLDKWVEFQTNAVLLDNLEVSPHSNASVHVPYHTVIALQDYDATRLGLPRYTACDVLVQLDGRPESARMDARIDFLPHEQYRPWDDVQIEGGMLYHHDAAYRLRPAQYNAVQAYKVIKQAGLHAFDDVIAAYKLLYDMRHMTRGDGVRVEGYMPRLVMDAVHYFRLFPAAQGFVLRPFLPHEASFEPVTLSEHALKPWSALWATDAPLPKYWVMPEHHYVHITPTWHEALSALRPQLRVAATREAAEALLNDSLKQEMRHCIR